MEVTEHCRSCQHQITVEVEQDDLDRWEAGELIQNVMPYLSAEEREFLISRICPNCWNELFEVMDSMHE
jgi:hypothetical protein